MAKQLNRELSYEKFFKWILSRDRFQRLFASEFTINSFLKNFNRLFLKYYSTPKVKVPAFITKIIYLNMQTYCPALTQRTLPLCVLL